MTTGRPTLKQIAAELGLGVTTVSRALSDASDISARTKDSVRKTAARMGYRRNSAGVTLRTGRTGVLCLILSPHDDFVGYGSSLLRGLTEGLRGSEYRLTVLPDFDADDPARVVARLITEGNCDGAIFSQTRPQDHRAKLLLEHDLPFVTHGRTELASAHATHDFDNQSFAYEAALRLVAKGCQRIALIAPPADLMYAHHMQLGLARALAQTTATHCETPDLSLLSPDADLMGWAGRTQADGIICGGERGALAVARGLSLAGRSLPIAAKHSSPILPLTHPEIDLCFEDLSVAGRRLAQLLQARLTGADDTTLTDIQPTQWAS